jgi:biotin carboxylase
VSAAELIKDRLQYPVMVKPSDGSGSKAVAKATNYLELIYACNATMEASQSHKAVIETFVVGQEYGVESFVLDGQIYVLGILKKKMTNHPYYAELGHCMPSELPIEIDRKVKQVVRQVIKALEINFGSVNMDVLIMDENKVCSIYIGARMGGNVIGSHIIPFAIGMDYMGNMFNTCVGEAVNFEIRTDTRCVVSSIMALTQGIEGDIIREYRNNLDGCVRSWNVRFTLKSSEGDKANGSIQNKKHTLLSTGHYRC